MSKSLLVTAQIGESSRKWVWDGEAPMGIGRPFRWIFERTDQGVRVRDISSRTGVIETGTVHEIPQAAIDKGKAEIRLQGIVFRVQPARELKAAFEAQAGDQLSAYSCLGDWVIESAPVANGYAGRVQDESVFTVTRAGSEGTFTLTSRKDGVETSQGKLGAGQTLSLSTNELRSLKLRAGAYSWRFGASPAVASLPSQAAAITLEEAEELRVFKKALIGTGAALAALFLLSFVSSYLWPHNEEELIPPQFASVVLTKTPAGSSAPAPKAEAVATESTSAAKQAAVPEKVQKAAVVQAFRAQALQNAVSGLLKGGMTKLLEQSDFVSGSKATADARKVFAAGSSALGATGELLGNAQGKNVQVAQVGGTGVGGKGVGYGKGEHAGVKGQGNSFVSLDLGNSSVEEGLTKDEVGEVIHKHLSEVRYCYESAMIRQPDIEGKLVISFVIGGSGVVKTADIKSSTLPDPRLDDCVLRRLVTWKFPQTKGGIDVGVTYPFIFKTLGR